MTQDTEQSLGTELENDVQPALETPSEPKEELSLRETINKAREDVRERDEKGKFTRTEPDVADKTAKKPEKQPTQVKNPPEKHQPTEPGVTKPEQDPAPPTSLSAAVRAKWGQLPPDVRAEFTKREADFHRELTKHDEERNFGRQIEKIVTPYVAQIKLEGATIPQAVESLFNMAHLLRVGTPQQKSELLLRTAKTFGVDLRQALQQTQTQVNPQIAALQTQLQNIQAELQREKNNKKQQEDNGIQEQISAFGADPKHPHFETVKPHMAALLKSGLAKDLQDAYDQAVYANPNTRSTVLPPPAPQGGNQQRVAGQRDRVEAARKAGSSLKGSPGASVVHNGKIPMADLRSTIKAAVAAVNEG